MQNINKKIWGILILFLVLFLSCKTTPDDTGKNSKIKNDKKIIPITPKDNLPIDREGWLNDTSFQIIESIVQSKNNETAIQDLSIRRTAHLIALDRYKLYKDEFYFIDRLAEFPPFIKITQGKVVHSTLEQGSLLFVYRIIEPQLKRKMKHVLNAYEEMNPALRKKIRDGDFSF